MLGPEDRCVAEALQSIAAGTNPPRHATGNCPVSCRQQPTKTAAGDCGELQRFTEIDGRNAKRFAVLGNGPSCDDEALFS